MQPEKNRIFRFGFGAEASEYDRNVSAETFGRNTTETTFGHTLASTLRGTDRPRHAPLRDERIPFRVPTFAAPRTSAGDAGADCASRRRRMRQRETTTLISRPPPPPPPQFHGSILPISKRGSTQIFMVVTEFLRARVSQATWITGKVALIL